jgi:hypothetical protein
MDQTIAEMEQAANILLVSFRSMQLQMTLVV